MANSARTTERPRARWRTIDVGCIYGDDALGQRQPYDIGTISLQLLPWTPFASI